MQYRTPFLATIIFCLVVFAGAWLPRPASANALVECRYLRARGNTIQLRLDIGSPPPATIILIQNLPPDVRIDQARPRFKKFSRQKGVAKWLLKDPGPGALLVTMRLSRPLEGNEVHGEIRYLDPGSGKMIKMDVRP